MSQKMDIKYLAEESALNGRVKGGGKEDIPGIEKRGLIEIKK